MPQVKYKLSTLQKSIYDWIQIDGEGVDQLIGKVSYKVSDNVAGISKDDADNSADNRDILISAITALIDDNPILKFVLCEENGECAQQEIDDTKRLIDYKEFASEEEVDSYAKDLQKSGLDITKKMSFFVAYRTDSTYGYIMQISHMITDGWSMMLIVDALDHILRNEPYKKYNNYIDVVVNKENNKEDNKEDNKADNTEALERDIDFWCEKLNGVSSKYLDLGNRASHISGSVIRSISRDKFAQIKEFCDLGKITAPQLFLTSVGVLVSKMSVDKDADTFVEFVLFNRRGIKERNTLGLFMKPMPIKINTEGNMSLSEVLKSSQAEMFEAYSHSTCLYDDVLLKQRDTNPNIRPLSDVSFNYLIEGAGDDSHNEIKWYPALTQRKVLEIEVTEWGQDGTADVSYHYDTAVFTETETNLIHERLMTIIDGFMTSDVTVDELDIIPDSEKELLNKMNLTDVSYQKDLTIPELFEMAVNRDPAKTAVIFEDSRISFEELNKKVNSVAAYIRECGIGRGDFVCLFLEKSIEMIIGILAAVKAGACYVPINPDYPKKRKEYILEDCKTKLILTYCDEDLVPDFAGEAVNLKTFDYDKYPSENPAIINEPEDHCYMIYTSGTTGNPKGVIIRHFSLNNLVTAYRRIYEITPDDKVLQSAQYVFDQSVQDIFLTSLSGATLVVATKEKQLSKDELCAYVNDNGVTAICMTPMAIATLNPDDFAGVRMLETGGGEANPAVLKKWVEKGVRVFNTYGPTEYTVNTTSFEYHGEDVTNIPIGRAINNTKLYVLKGTGLCGIGVPGELCISGDNIAVGYFNNEELTARAFVDNPFVSELDSEGISASNEMRRMYRTGDLCRILEDGNVEYLGRIDEQVKIRGFRIELGEIDAAIRDIDFIDDCAIIAGKDAKGDDAISAYVVAEEAVDFHEVKRRLAERMPRYMIPGYFMQLDSLPRTVNGKLDKKALPIIENQLESEYVPPKTETQKVVAEIFEKVLEKDRVGNNDDFFELGGHSLRAVYLLNEIESRLQVRVKIGIIFEYTTPQMLGDYIDANRENLKITGGDEKIPVTPDRDYYPMSSSQKRMYLAWLMDKQSMAYNMSVIYHIDGAADEGKLRRTFDRLIETHPEFRTSYFMENDKFCQRIEESVDFEMEISDSADGFFRPFDLNKAPLIRARFVKNDTDPKLLIDVHHSISDGATVTLMMRDFATIYNGGDIENEKIRFVDYSVWMEGRDLNSQKKFWTDMYIDSAPVFDMPTDFPRPKLHSAKGSSEFHLIDKAKIRDFGKNHQMTDFMVIMAGIMLFMSKYGRTDDVVVGTPISARMNTDSESIFGMFVNTLAVRGYPSADKKIEDFLKEVKATCMQIYENQEYPFDELLDDINAVRDPSRNPLFDVMFVLQNNENAFDTPEDVLKMDEITLNREHSRRAGAKVDMTFEVIEQADAYEVELEYCTDLFTAESAKRILRHFESVFDSLSSGQAEYIKDIVISTKDETEMILSSFGGSDVTYCDDTIVSLLQEMIKLNPDGIAITYRDTSVTYSQLSKMIDFRACELLDGKIGEAAICPGDVVAIVGERCIDMVVSVYAALTVGAAYVMIDKNMPKERRDFIIEETKAKCVIEVSAENDASAVGVAVADNTELAGIRHIEGLCTDPDSAAYLIYTSGTSGKPKGVKCRHRGIVNLINWLKKNYPIGADGRLLEKTNLTFVDSTYEMFWALSSGREMVILPQGDEMFMDRLGDKIKNSQITNIVLVPTVLNELLSDRNAKENLDSLRTIVLSGEPLKTAVVKKAQEILNKSCVIINQYGQTEGGFSSTYYEIRMDKEDRNLDTLSIVPAGKSIDRVHHYIVDNGKLCGIGVPGEICIAADGLSIGYVNNPELDKTKYSTCSFDRRRLVHTGDLGRWLPDGNVVCMGRMDDQIKIRGQRIELGEIDAVIRKQAEVEDCAVLAMNLSGENDEKSIVAYVVRKGAGNNADENDFAEGLRDVLIHELPQFMIPSAIVELDELPFTRNGKLDKKALPVPKVEQTDYVEPQNDTQRDVCAAFEEVLGIEKVGIKDDFFMIGGHSLKAAYLCNVLGPKFMVQLSINDIFAHQTPEKLAAFILTLPQNEELFAPIPKAEVKPYYEMTSPQKRFYIANAKDPNSLAFLMSFTIMTGELDEVKLAEAFKKVVMNHSCFRLSFPVVDGTAYQKLDDEVEFQLEVTDEDTDDFHKPFDLAKAPLMRARYVRGQKLYIDIHHIILDGASTTPFFKELFDIYGGADIPAEKISFIDYSEWMRNKDLSNEKSYWMNIYKEEAPVLDIPTDKPRHGIRSYEGNTIVSHVSKSAVGDFAKRNGLTDYTVLISAFMIMLSKYSNMDDIVVGTPVSGRIHRDIEKIPGVFINTIALRGFPKAEMKTMDFLKNMQETCLHGFAAQSYPFDDLVADLKLKHSSDRSPLFDVMMILQNNEDEFKSDMEIISNRSGSKMDMILEIVDDGEYRLNYEYSTDLFTDETAHRMLGAFENILSQITTESTDTISEFEILSAENAQKILNFSCVETIPFSEDESIVSTFKGHVDSMPDKVALFYNEEQVTYKELWDISRNVAFNLCLNGAGKGDVIALIGRRGLKMPECMYGTLIAGAAFTTIDDQLPNDRILEIIKECKSRFAVRDGILYENYGLGEQKTLGDVFTIPADDKASSVILPKVMARDIAYVHFTSGTDGKPKGVRVPHYGMVINSKVTRGRFKDVDEFISLQSGNYSFVLGLYALLLTHMSLGSVDVLPQDAEKDTGEIIRHIKNRGIEVILMTPTMMERIIDSAIDTDSMKDISSLKYLLPGGEALKIASAKKILENMSGKVHLINQYGQTEASTVVSVSTEVTMKHVEDGYIPMGKPVKGICIYIAQGNRLCDIGIPGEVCIGGNGITAGYLDEELNRKKFRDLIIPCNDSRGFRSERVYCTGDLAIWQEDGTIRGLGRRDGQIKINGQRVEIGDVISAIRKLPDVSDCTVIAAKDSSEHLRLCAYLVMDEDKFNVGRIKNSLLMKLPSYMVPSSYNRIDAIPVTRNGKLDKKALPEPVFVVAGEYVAPSNEMEKFICDAFAKILSLEKVGIKDNFYDIGGDSLKSIDLVLEIARGLADSGKECGVVDILRLQTPELIAAFLMDTDSKDMCILRDIPRPEKSCAPKAALKKILAERKNLTKEYTELVPSVSNIVFLKYNKENNVIMKIEISKEISLEKSLESFSKVVAGSGFEYVFDSKTSKYYCYNGRRDSITVLDISEEEADSLIWDIHDTLYKFDNKNLLSDVFAISPEGADHHSIYYCIHHSQCDRYTSSLIERRMNSFVLDKPLDDSDTSIEFNTDSEEQTKSAAELWERVKTIDKIMNGTDYERIVMTEPMTEADYRQPILKILKMYSDNNPLLKEAGMVPFIMVASGRNESNYNKLGCYLEYRFYLYDVNAGALYRIDDLEMEESILLKINNVPLLNYIGIFKDSRTREDVMTIRKGFERARYLHASVYEGELVLKAPVYFKKKDRKR